MDSDEPDSEIIPSNHVIQPTRRQVMAALAATAIQGVAAAQAVSQTRAAPEILRLGRASERAIPSDYVGLSYESAQLADEIFFAAENCELVALFRQLAPRGVLRIGGNSSEFCWWKAGASDREPQLPDAVRGADRWMPHRLSAITPQAVDRLAGFLDATGWRLIYGLNLGGLSLGAATTASGAEEAAYVARTIDKRLLFFQIGNEPDFYGNANTRLRGAEWNFERYLEEWTAYAQAVAGRVPQARFGGPDVGSNVDWALRFAAEAPKRLPGRIVACTSHYYAEGPPDSPKTTMERLLRPDARLEQKIDTLTGAASRAGLEYRMTEANSCYRGGKAGMSDAFGSALWAIEFMLELAERGTVGVNFHGGGSKQIRQALGDHLPGGLASGVAPTDGQARRTAAANAQGSFYTPIAGSVETGFVPRPIFYGMKLAGLLAGGRMCRVTTDGGATVEGVWAAQMPNGSTRMIAVNAGRQRRLTIATHSAARVWRLETASLNAASLNATSGERLAGAAIQADKVWKPHTAERVASHAGKVEVRLSTSSAAVIFLDHSA